jgi:hypothetical protein
VHVWMKAHIMEACVYELHVSMDADMHSPHICRYAWLCVSVCLCVCTCELQFVMPSSIPAKVCLYILNCAFCTISMCLHVCVCLCAIHMKYVPTEVCPLNILCCLVHVLVCMHQCFWDSSSIARKRIN